jgi:hypothetical protein
MSDDQASPPPPLAVVQSAHLRQSLRTALAAAGKKPSQAGELLGRSANFGPRLLDGRSRLRLPDVFALLLALEIKPDRFLRFAFPLALPVEQALALLEVRERNPSWLPMVFGPDHLEEQATLVSTIWDADEWTAEVLRVLTMYLAEAQLSNDAVADRLELSRSNWHRLLAGDRALTFEQLFEVLEVCEIDLARFVWDLAAPVRTAAGRLRHRENLLTFEPIYREELERVAERRAAAQERRRVRTKAPRDDD